ncbi:probable helicase MAGATAMA 3 [Triticum dicoccoides]|uniref:probable helicase MAGATAMA 3 n=1 Tax=Triticum dicoccoides TaxID=85692 RepID=UPI00188F8219|nr:probable helicase MAGATAMA 3 [Triticum dicoccoides]
MSTGHWFGAPTKNAVVEVASRVLRLLEDESYGGGGKPFSQGNVVLLGKEDRMNVDENLAKIFLERHVYRLVNVAASWRHYVYRMLELLAKPLSMHSSYLKDVRSARKGDILRQQGSINIRRVRDFEPFELLVVDEAAQLKECESLIPLQLGIRRAVLIGDERQLPAFVKSKLSAEAGFGRSLFERLSLLGHPKHLLAVQYRMHPEISKFPTFRFYQSKVTDGPNVLHRDYERKLLAGPMYGPYSFINIQCWMESSEKHDMSQSNPVEVAAVTRIVQRLFQESSAETRSKLSVGVISPYKAQVRAIQESLALEHENYSGLSVKIGTVDGFQGAEADVIIFSAVRANTKGKLGFLPDERRTNVALTRAKHCFWILGNSATLSKRKTIWQEIVADAKERGCFYDGNDDKDLLAAMSIAIKQDEINRLGIGGLRSWKSKPY